MKTLFAAAISIPALLSLSAAIQAGEIDIAGVTTNALTFTEKPGISLEVSSALGFEGNGTYIPTSGTVDIGTALFGPLDFLTGPESSAGDFIPIPPAIQTFQYVSTIGPNDLKAIITWTDLVANAPIPGEPQLIGNAFITDSVGDLDLTTDFPKGGSFTVIANFPIAGPCDLTELASMTCSTTFETVSFEGAGIKDAPPTSTPEPGSVILLLTMLAAAIGFHGYTRRTETTAMINRARALL